MNLQDRIFENLDRWRHLPAYQLERRADIFFSIYLKGLVEEVTGVELKDEILPELPLKQDATNRSDKVDYALFSKDGRQIFFVELKTDVRSRNAGQDRYLAAAKRDGFRRIVIGLCAIMRVTAKRRKYLHLAEALNRLGYVTLPPSQRDGDLAARLASIRPTDTDATIEVLYVQPETTLDVRSINFSQFASYVERHADPLSQAFAKYLRLWCTEAGSCEPF